MGKNISKYNVDDKVELTDKLIGSENGTRKTKNYKVGDILALQDERYLSILLAFRYADSASQYNENVSGYFTSDSDDLSVITQLKFNKTSYTGDDATEYLRTIQNQIASATYELNVKASDNSPNYVRFLITSMSEESQHFQINGQIIAGSSNGEFVDEGRYLFHDVKTSSSTAGGDMLRSTYDSNFSGVVDDSELVNGHTVESDVPAGAVFTDTQVDIQEGDNITIDKTDPLNPVISATGGGGGGGDMYKVVYDTGNNGIVDNSERLGAQLPSYYGKQSDVLNLQNTRLIDVKEGSGVAIDKTDPLNPIISTAPYTTAGYFDNEYFTADNLVLPSGTYKAVLTNDKGIGTEFVNTVSVPDNTKVYYTQEFIGTGNTIDVEVAAGNYSGSLAIEIDSAGSNTRVGADVWLTDADGVDIQLFVTASTGVFDMDANDKRDMLITANVSTPLTVLAGQRFKYKFWAEKTSNVGVTRDVSIYVGTDHNSFFNTPKAITTDAIINASNIQPHTNLTPALNQIESEKLEWEDQFIAGSHKKGVMTKDGGFVMLSNKDTAEPAAPVQPNDPEWEFSGALTRIPLVSTQVIAGCRYTFPELTRLSAYRFDAVAGNSYTLMSVKNPETAIEFRQVISQYVADKSGIIENNVGDIILEPNTIYDLYWLIKQPNSVDVKNTYTYNYLTTQTDTIPADGQITQSNKNPDKMFVSKLDSDLVDRSAFLSTMSLGDIISSGNNEWSIQYAVAFGSYYELTVAPALQHDTVGLESFTFSTTQANPITYSYASNYWLGNSNRQGFFASDGTYEDAILFFDDNLYMFDLKLVELQPSADWDFVTYNSGEIRGGTPIATSDIINITWEELVALTTREALQKYNITKSTDPTKDYGKVQLLSADIFQWVDNNGLINKITII